MKKCMEWRVPDQEIEQRELGERLWKRLSSMEIEQGGCHGSQWMEEADKGRLMIRKGVSG